ncbi:protein DETOXIFICATION 45, chloroplastic isoform X3 [Nymphaea colorata]|uniref:protein DETOXIFICATION 45, chloroplastic isoform X3 n=1 Tax=Nymphaea colorata TaxID=210225 RepID=UPI00214EF96D|nr:protein DETOXIFICATION 45, chloroplastic isoform X3 [Nymphaea colorata]
MMEAMQLRSAAAETTVYVPRGRIPGDFKRVISCCVRSSALQSKVESSIVRWSKRQSLFSGERQFEVVVPRRGSYGRTTRITSCSDCNVGPYRSGESLVHQRGSLIDSIKEGISVLIGRSPNRSTFSTVESELIVLSIPAMVGQAIEPLSQLLETAYVGRLGPLELASVGVSVSIFNIISKLFNIPLLSVTTSFVAADIAKSSKMDSIGGLVAEKKQLPSVSTAILLAAGIGMVEAFALYVGAGSFLNVMGIPPDSPMWGPSQRFLSLRALGAPAVVVSLAIQGVFRGFKDTKTPLLCTGIGNLAAVFLFPLLMYSLGLGVSGAAASVVVSQERERESTRVCGLHRWIGIFLPTSNLAPEHPVLWIMADLCYWDGDCRYIITILLIWLLSKKVILLPPKMQDLQFGGYMKSGGFLLGRTLSVLMTMTLGTAMAARQGPVAMAAHQICLQVWLAVSLLTDALSLSGQVGHDC